MVTMRQPIQEQGAGHGKLVRKDGRFVVPELVGLNPESLIG